MSTQHVLYVLAEGISLDEPKDLVVELNSGDLYICNGEVHKVSSSLSSEGCTNNPSEIQEPSLYMARNTKATIPTNELNCGELVCISRGSKSDELFVGGGRGVFKINLTSKVVTKFCESYRTPTLFCDPITENVYFGNDKNVVIVNKLTGKKENFDGARYTNWGLFEEPYGLAMDSLGNLYISDIRKNQVFKCSHLTMEVTVFAGNDKEYGIKDSKEEIGDGGLATDSRLISPTGIVIDPITDDLYIADFYLFRIRKVSSTTGFISTFAGGPITGKSENGTLARNTQFNLPRNVDIDFNGVVYVADRNNNRVCKLVPIYNQRLKKYERDLMNNVNITCCLYVFQTIAPSFYSLLTNVKLISSLDAKQVEIVQHLVDYLIYNIDDHYWYLNYCILDVLSIIGMIKDPQIRTLKNRMIRKFMNEFTTDNCVQILEKAIKFKEVFPPCDLIDRLLDFVFERIAETLKTKQDLIHHPIIQHQVLDIAKKFTKVCLGKPTPIELESSTIETFPKFELLFNEKTTSDIIIKIGSIELYCHKTILSSYSSYFESLFNVGNLFQDLKNNTYEIETECFDQKLHEMIIKYCYGMFDLTSITSELFIPLLQCSSFYNVTQIFNYCVENFEITKENVEIVQSQLEGFNNQRIDERFQNYWKGLCQK